MSKHEKGGRRGVLMAASEEAFNTEVIGPLAHLRGTPCPRSSPLGPNCQDDLSELARKTPKGALRVITAVIDSNPLDVSLQRFDRGGF